MISQTAYSIYICRFFYQMYCIIIILIHSGRGFNQEVHHKTVYTCSSLLYVTRSKKMDHVLQNVFVSSKRF